MCDGMGEKYGSTREEIYVGLGNGMMIWENKL